ncbi:MAG: hypothetical protein ACKO34_08325 [Vampirovibrionales bacterium]
MSTSIPNVSTTTTRNPIANTLAFLRNNAFWEIAAVEAFGSVLPQILLFVQTNSERADRFFTCGLEWLGQFPGGFLWNKLLKERVFEPWFQPETLTEGQKRTYNLGLSVASIVPVSSYVFFLPSLRNSLRAKVLHHTNYVDAIGLDKKAGDPHQKAKKEEEEAIAKQGIRTFALGQVAGFAAAVAAIAGTAVALKQHRYELPDVTWTFKHRLPKLPALGSWYQQAQQRLAKGFDLKPLDFWMVPNGDVSQLSPLQEAAASGVPVYSAYLTFAQDKVETGDILPRMLTYAFSIPFGPSAVLDKPWAKQPFKGKQFPILGDGKNAQLLLRLGLSCMVYTGLPQAYTLLTRQKRAEKAGLIHRRDDNVVSIHDPIKPPVTTKVPASSLAEPNPSKKPRPLLNTSPPPVSLATLGRV